jgi:hypothetical protein
MVIEMQLSLLAISDVLKIRLKTNGKVSCHGLEGWAENYHSSSPYLFVMSGGFVGNDGAIYCIPVSHNS